jgi:2-polyprenyl-3-methyl-5-hydroxy-6-metoxy-1,4-benzoquinol methylase
MGLQSFDPVQYKAEQHQLWNSAAAGWERWWPTQERALQHISDRLVDMAGIRPGYRILDIGTGIGEPAITVGRRIGPAGHIVAIDQSPQMLAVAKRRAAALGMKNLEFLEMDAEALESQQSDEPRRCGRISRRIGYQPWGFFRSHAMLDAIIRTVCSPSSFFLTSSSPQP